MRIPTAVVLVLTFVLICFAVICPFLPGRHDPVSVPLSLLIQVYSTVGLLTCIPAALWLMQTMNRKKSMMSADPGVKYSGRIVKVYAWTHFFLLLLMITLAWLSMSKLLAIVLFIALIIVTRLILKNASDPIGIFSTIYLPLALTLFPIFLLSLQFTIAIPLTTWSRNRAINNSSEIIGELERYKLQYDSYPVTLNANWKDYETGIVGIEKYHYSHDDSTYNLYFEQPRFLWDQFGTIECVVYNPKDNHVILSHASWHMLLGPDRSRHNQGWYMSSETGVPHWNSFLFD